MFDNIIGESICEYLFVSTKMSPERKSDVGSGDGEKGWTSDSLFQVKVGC